MKLSLYLTVVSACGGLMATAATAPVYVNDGPVQSPPDFLPPIDATSFLNRSTFSIFSTLPFETLNTLYYTNSGSGALIGTPGYRLIYNANGFRTPAARIVNQGSINASTYLFLRATNIIDSGPIDCGALALGHLEGDDISLRRAGLRVGPALNGFQDFGGLEFVDNNGNIIEYINDAGIVDQYWAIGINNRLDNRGRPMPLGTSFGGFTFTPFDLPFPQSPVHQVMENLFGLPFTTFASVPLFFSTNQFGAFVFTNQISPTSSVIQVAFVPVTFSDTNLSVDVSFLPDADDGATVQVTFSQADFDIVNEVFFTNQLIFSDSLAFGTNLLSTNIDLSFLPTGSFRPSNYELTRSPFFLFGGFGFGFPSNAPFSPDLIFNPIYRSNAVPVRYTAYAASIVQPGQTNVLISIPAVNDPTNFPGRLEILGKKLNLDQSRLRAENTLIIKTADLSSNRVARVDAPFLIYDLTSTQPELVITNLAPVAVRRLSGQLAAWSAVWTNIADHVITNVISGAVTTNVENIAFHVLILDAQLQSLQPVNLFQFIARATNLVIADNLSIGKTLLIDALGVHITGGLALPPFGSLASSNLVNVRNFTNDGVINLTGSANFGADRFTGTNNTTPVPYANFINRGSLLTASTLIRSVNYANIGSGLQAGSGLISCGSGIFQLETLTGRMTNTTLLGSGDVVITAKDFIVQDTFISAGSNTPGALVISATNTLTDGGPGAGNEWFVTSGFQFLRRPQGPGANDLLGTTLQSSAGRFLEIFHIWAAENRGADPSGFTNNLALGRLILDGADLSLFTFSGAGSNDALYVDFLDLRNNATNYDTALQVNPGLTIYFANASVPPNKLDGRQGGRLRWVSGFAGPNSSTNIFYPAYNKTYTFNVALV
ncbi:MAG TPA: hypothetical protein VGK40_11450, partial [Verrucomicrobiae bacterium]